MSDRQEYSTAKQLAAPPRKRAGVTAVVRESDESIDLESWARGLVRAVIAADREQAQVAGVVEPVAEAS